MTSRPRETLTSLPKGYQFPPATFQISSEHVARYLDAVGDSNAVYRERGLAPPLAVAARALGALLEVLELPGGTLHTGQEVDIHAGLPLDAELSLSGRLAQRSERGGVVISVIEFEVTAAGSPAPAISGRTTVAAPAGASQ